MHIIHNYYIPGIAATIGCWQHWSSLTQPKLHSATLNVLQFHSMSKFHWLFTRNQYKKEACNCAMLNGNTCYCKTTKLHCPINYPIIMLSSIETVLLKGGTANKLRWCLELNMQTIEWKLLGRNIGSVVGQSKTWTWMSFSPWASFSYCTFDLERRVWIQDLKFVHFYFVIFSS